MRGAGTCILVFEDCHSKSLSEGAEKISGCGGGTRRLLE